MRPVMFGEYVPLGSYLPWLYRLTPLAGGIQAGEAPQSLSVGRRAIAPKHLLRDAFAALHPRLRSPSCARDGAEPDLLVNLTNDGWFWGSSELDLHLMCGVFRAVECRKPLLIAANTGFSAVVDADGRILRQGPRRDTAVLVENVKFDSRRSPYVRFGDWGAGLCLLFGFSMAVVGCAKWSRRKPTRLLRARA